MPHRRARVRDQLRDHRAGHPPRRTHRRSVLHALGDSGGGGGDEEFRDLVGGGDGRGRTAVPHLSQWSHRRFRRGVRVRRGVGLGGDGTGPLSLRPVDRHRVARAPQDREAAAEAVATAAGEGRRGLRPNSMR